MRYRREDTDGDYTFGCGDDTWLINSPEAVAQAVKTRFALWYGQWFLDKTEGTPWIQSVLGKQKAGNLQSGDPQAHPRNAGREIHPLFQYHSEHDDAPRPVLR